jgi:hypothetical protein
VAYGVAGGAEGIRTGGHRGRVEISSWTGYENDIVEVMDNRPDPRALLLDPSDAERVKTKKDLRQAMNELRKVESVFRRGSDALLMTIDHVAPMTRACKKSRFPRPYIWRLTSLSLQICPSAWPLDQP